MAYKFEKWNLYRANINLKNRRKIIVYFFSRWKPIGGIPCNLPKGYTVLVNDRTGLPYPK